MHSYISIAKTNYIVSYVLFITKVKPVLEFVTYEYKLLNTCKYRTYSHQRLQIHVSRQYADKLGNEHQVLLDSLVLILVVLLLPDNC